MTDAPVASTRSGAVRGLALPASAEERRRRDVLVFRGIPFAAPTTGEGRFRPPTREASWTEVRDATEHGHIAPQAPSPLDTMFGGKPLESSEDCLSVNLWTPAVDDGRRPVMVWIHGGSFQTGSGSSPWYDGARFAANHDLVVVTVNYRLGAFGNIHLAGVGADDDTLSSNCGLLDQVAALGWVRDSIAGFGGDPGQVTLFGESAGAMSVATLLATPAARGLFHRAIMESGACHVSTPEEATRTAVEVLTELGLSPDAIGAKALRDVPADRLLAASETVANRAALATGVLSFQPVVDGATLPVAPLEAIQAGIADGVDVLFGTNRDEMRLFLLMDASIEGADRDALARRCRPVFGERAGEVVDVYAANRPGVALRDVWADIATDMVFRWPAHRLATAKSASAGRMWAYEFCWPTPAFGGRLGSCHALEIPFVFDNLDKPGIDYFTGTGEERQRIADVMHAAWSNFARTGDPNGPAALDHGSPEWPAYDVTARPTFTLDASFAVAADPRGEELALWPR